MRIRILGVAVLVLLVGSLESPRTVQACNQSDQDQYLLAPGFVVRDYCVVAPRHRNLNFYRDIPAQNADHTVNTVTEIPAGTNEKFEVNEDTGKMCWELKNGVPRVIKYLGYPANYGMVPRTMGGDGDSLDLLTLGKFERRGKILAVKVIGVIYLDDGGEQDDKLIAVLPGTDFYAYDNLSALEADYVGIKNIIETWFANYKGPGELKVIGFGDAAEAQSVLDAAKAAYQ
jgi:inorganic pyrophosphatase